MLNVLYTLRVVSLALKFSTPSTWAKPLICIPNLIASSRPAQFYPLSSCHLFQPMCLSPRAGTPPTFDHTYPTSRTLADIAVNSVSLEGAYLQPGALAEATKRQSAAYVHATDPKPQPCTSGRLALPCRRVCPARQAQAQWFSSGHHVLPTRQHLRVSFTSPLQHASSPALPAVALALPQPHHLGFCPRSLRAAHIRVGMIALICAHIRLGMIASMCA